MPHRILLYDKPGCHLCEIAHQLLLGLRREFELTIVEQDISQDPSLYEKYWDKIPVIVVDDHTVLAAPIRVAEVRAALGKQEMKETGK